MERGKGREGKGGMEGENEKMRGKGPEGRGKINFRTYHFLL